MIGFLSLVGRASALFAVTNVDDLLVLILFFGQAGNHPGLQRRVWVGQYIGFVAILTVTSFATLGFNLFAPGLAPYLGVVPLALGLRLGIAEFWSWRKQSRPGSEVLRQATGIPTIWSVAAVVFANGGDNVGLYVPFFIGLGLVEVVACCALFLVLVAVWCVLGRGLAQSPPVARALARWGRVILPAVLVVVGLHMLVDGGAIQFVR